MTDRWSGASSVDAYIAECPPDVQPVLQEMRNLIKAAAPDATETISYSMPTFDLNRRHLVHFAAFKHHIGLYPTPSGIEAFQADLAPYKTSKGAVQFPLGQPLPTDLIRRIVEFRVTESVAATPADDFPAGISQPARRALAGAGYTQLDQLTQVTEAALLQLHGMGPKALGLLKAALAAQGQTFADQ